AALFAPESPAAATVSSSPAADGPDESTGGVSMILGAPRSAAVVRTGLDVLAEQGFAPFRGHAIGLVTNQTGVDLHGRRNIDLLAAAPGIRLVAIFSPEHGITGTENTEVANSRDTATGVPIWSLYGPTRRPTSEMLRGISLLVFDIQDVGARYYTYLTTLVYVMEEAGRRGIPLVVLDRPNPITGRVVEGPVMDPDLKSFTAPHPIPVRTGLTIGEFGRLVAGERKLPVSLTVVPVSGWDRGRWYDETGLPWVNPSPNIRSVTQALLYSGIGLLEATNLSVGRGTDSPFEVIGAPWIDAPRLAEALNGLRMPGVRFDPGTFTPGADRYANTPCWGVRMVVTDREAIRPVTVALALGRALREHHREQFRAENIQHLLVHRPTMWAFLRSEPIERLVTWAEAGHASFLNRRASYLIYP
ncbi:MAG: exo-beta-N-acetylmuramidase NamZ family protein, partial [Candidatus Rokuibacteriota bacterium]